MRVVVLDMQPIDPPVGGGRRRLLGLYHRLGLATRYVGSWDWPVESAREIRLSPTLVEVDTPLSPEHFAAERAARVDLPGVPTVIDVTFSRLAHLSPAYVERARSEVMAADVAVFSHPWVYPLVADRLDPRRQLIVYDAQNVEGVLRAQLLDDGDGPGSRLVREVIETELALCEHAHLVLACAHEDLAKFSAIYGVSHARMRVVRNGAFPGVQAPDGERTSEGVAAQPRAAARKAVGVSIEGTVAIFLGSGFGPNVEAARWLLREVVPALPEVTFVLAGGVGPALGDEERSGLPSGVLVTGPLEEPQMCRWLEAADLALNPVVQGSGHAVKMLDYFAAALPVVTTPMGARGLVQSSGRSMRVVSREGFTSAIRDLLADPETRQRMSEAARRWVERDHSWPRISADLGALLARHFARLARPAPRFSVVIPTLDRPDRLGRLLERLRDQTYKDFEVLLVDQSARPWQPPDDLGELDLHVATCPVADVVRARNQGAFLSRGEILAFTDDDCEPAPDWLESAERTLRRDGVIGVEGWIRSESGGDLDLRPVNNDRLAGLGFMTANLFLRRDVFAAIDGFDPRFGPLHREDTDLAWRALAFGEIPFRTDVVVHHPPHRRAQERESEQSRASLFRRDPVLLDKHPVLYQELFLHESHWRLTPGFWENFLAGAQEQGLEVPEFYRARLGEAVVEGYPSAPPAREISGRR